MALTTKTVTSRAANPSDATMQIAAQLEGEDLKAVMLFVSSDYDLDELGAALKTHFSVPIIGCTSAGHIGLNGYENEGLQATGFFGDSIEFAIEYIAPLSRCQEIVSHLGAQMRQKLSYSKPQRFGLLFVDGLSLMEERLAASLHHCFPDIPLIGGSAGDNLKFERTFIYKDGRFISDAAVLALCETDVSIHPFKFQHFVPKDDILVVTEADEEKRVVKEFNGEPAAIVYARTIGVDVNELSPELYSSSPLILKVGADYYVRSIQQINDDMSLRFYCAIATGLVLRLGQAQNPKDTMRSIFKRVRQKVPNTSIVLGCDCILRKLEFEQSNILSDVGQIMSDNHVVGFSTYGEQFNALHMNQTFTGLALGGTNE